MLKFIHSFYKYVLSTYLCPAMFGKRDLSKHWKEVSECDMQICGIDFLDSFKVSHIPISFTQIRICLKSSTTECSQDIKNEGYLEWNDRQFELQNNLIKGRFGALHLECLVLSLHMTPLYRWTNFFTSKYLDFSISKMGLFVTPLYNSWGLNKLAHVLRIMSVPRKKPNNNWLILWLFLHLTSNAKWQQSTAKYIMESQ